MSGDCDDDRYYDKAHVEGRGCGCGCGCRCRGAYVDDGGYLRNVGIIASVLIGVLALTFGAAAWHEWQVGSALADCRPCLSAVVIAGVLMAGGAAAVSVGRLADRRVDREYGCGYGRRGGRRRKKCDDGCRGTCGCGCKCGSCGECSGRCCET